MESPDSCSHGFGATSLLVYSSAIHRNRTFQNISWTNHAPYVLGMGLAASISVEIALATLDGIAKGRRKMDTTYRKRLFPIQSLLSVLGIPALRRRRN